MFAKFPIHLGKRKCELHFCLSLKEPVGHFVAVQTEIKLVTVSLDEMNQFN